MERIAHGYLHLCINLFELHLSLGIGETQAVEHRLAVFAHPNSAINQV